jgi:predicted  nucleic acid-binding Zn-ribbon protein
MRKNTFRHGPTVAALAACVLLALSPRVFGQSDAMRRIQIRMEMNNLRMDIASLNRQIAATSKDYDAAKKAADATATALEAAKKAAADSRPPVEQARSALADATRKVDTVTRQLRQAFEASDEMKAALDALQQAQHAVAQARAKALAPLQATDAYKAAVDARQAAKAKLDQTKAAGNPNNLEIPILAGLLIEKDSAVNTMEMNVLEADPDWVAADKALNEAVAHLAGLRNAFDAGLAQNPDRLAAVKEVEEANAAFKKAVAARNDAEKAQSDAEAANRKAAAELARIQKFGQGLEDSKANDDDQIQRLQNELNRLH